MGRVSSAVPRALLGFSALLALAGACAEDECDFNSATRDVGGIGLMDCGIAGEDTSAVDSCAVMAHRQGAIFRAIYETEEGGLEAIVHGSDGEYSLLRIPAPNGPVERADCAGAEVVDEAGRTRVSCVNPGPFAVVCE